MSYDTDQQAAQAAGDFARDLAIRWASELGCDILGVYLIGSLAHGGFSRRYSDVDIAVVTEMLLAPAALDRLRATANEVSVEFSPKLSIFFTGRDFTGGRFPPLDRADYLDHAVALTERNRITPSRPSLSEVRAYLAAAPFANWARTAAQFAAADTLTSADRKSYLRALLYPARLVFSFMTGRMTSNDEAVSFVQERGPVGLDTDLILRALTCRQAAADPDPIFSERALLTRQVEACLHFLHDSVDEHG